MSHIILQSHTRAASLRRCAQPDGSKPWESQRSPFQCSPLHPWKSGVNQQHVLPYTSFQPARLRHQAGGTDASVCKLVYIESIPQVCFVWPEKCLTCTFANNLKMGAYRDSDGSPL